MNMNIDRKTPIGKAVQTDIEHDARPEVEGHVQAGLRDNNRDRIQRATEETSPEADAEVENHRSFSAQIHDVPEGDGDDQEPEVEGHIKRF
jgi:hypothetical protein